MHSSNDLLMTMIHHVGDNLTSIAASYPHRAVTTIILSSSSVKC